MLSPVTQSSVCEQHPHTILTLMGVDPVRSLEEDISEMGTRELGWSIGGAELDVRADAAPVLYILVAAYR